MSTRARQAKARRRFLARQDRLYPTGDATAAVFDRLWRAAAGVRMPDGRVPIPEGYVSLWRAGLVPMMPIARADYAARYPSAGTPAGPQDRRIEPI